MGSFHGLRAWAARTARQFFRWDSVCTRAAIATVVIALWAGTAKAQFVVTTTADNGDNTSPTAGSLRAAIEAANAAGTSTSSITFNLPAGSTIALASNLPPIEANVTIDGSGAPGLKVDGGGHNAAFFVDNGSVTIANLAIANTNAVGGAGGLGGAGGGGGLGAGGALFVNETATVTVKNVVFQDNAATGGAGGFASPANHEGGGGGGGFHGAGGASQPGGGGGGGFMGAGGAAADGAAGGGGGGGEFGNGGNYPAGATGNRNGGTGGGGTNPGEDGSPGSGGVGGAGGGTSGGTGGTENGASATAGTAGGGGGGAAGNTGGNSAGNGGKFGGGGGAGWGSTGGAAGTGGAFGGGGGGGSNSSGGGAGGFGGGGGGASDTNGNAPGAGGFGGGSGGTYNANVGTGGTGGNGYGGAVFVRTGGTLILDNSNISGSTVTAGAGGGFTGNGANGADGTTDGSAIYAMSGFSTDIEVDSGNQTLSDTIGGAGGLIKTGAGTLTLSGANDYTGLTEVSQGTLNLTGSITSNTTVDPGATLSGNGTINNNLTNNGKIDLANTISVMNVNGNFTQNSGGEVQIGINATPNSPIIGTNSSFLAVQNSTGSNVAGAIEIIAAPGNYSVSNTSNPNPYYYLIGVQGTHSFSVTANLDGVPAGDVQYNSMSVVYQGVTYDAIYMQILQAFTIDTNFAAYAQTPNQLAVANYIDTNSGNPALSGVINALNSLSPAGVQNALDQMSGNIYGSVAQTDLQSTTLELSFLTRRLGNGLMGASSGGLATNSYGDKISAGSLASLDSGLTVRGQSPWGLNWPRQGRWTTWGFGYGLGGNASGNANAAGLNYSLGGTVAGLETHDENRVLGMYAGYVGSHLGSYMAGQSVNVNGGQTGVYLRGDDGRNYYILLGGMGADGYNSHRLMQFGGINTTANANYGGWQSQAYFERGLTFQGNRGSIQPYAALQYLYVRQNSFVENGAGAMNLNVAGTDANSLRSLIGIRLSGNGWTVNDRAITPVARALWLHEFLSTSTGINAQFAPIGGTNFAVTGTSLGRDWAILGAGLNWNLGCGWQTYANYDAQVNVAQVFHVGSGGFQYSW